MSSKRTASNNLSEHISKRTACALPADAAQNTATREVIPDSCLDSVPHARSSQISIASEKPILEKLVASTTTWAGPVYRLRGLPTDINKYQICSILSITLDLENNKSELRIRSLAAAPDSKTMMATVLFQTTPMKLSDEKRNEWSFDITDLLFSAEIEDKEDGRHIRQRRILTIDSHFRGLTVLSSPPLMDHKVDCLAVSGLGANAFGSFKERGGSHMWLCDKLPEDLATCRIIIYGYESKLHGSNSFQNIEALATSLRTSVERLGRVNQRKPLFFIAHSLGGLLVKEAIIQMHDDSTHGIDMMNSIYGALFFGVPNQGMDITSLIPMVKDQANQELLHSLDRESQLLRNQTRKFPVAFNFPDSRIMCFYETVESRTAKQVNGIWTMDGPFACLVGSASATHARPWENQPHHVQGINRNHSELVKFKPNDEVYDRVLGTLEGFAEEATKMKRLYKIQRDTLTEDDRTCLKSLAFPEMRYRENEVQDTRADSCLWIIEHEIYINWMRDQHSLLWIKGHPGTGKSTLMKRIYKENMSHTDIQLSYFYHRRGVQLQQTPLGMLRTMLHQLISQSDSARAAFGAWYNEKKIFGEHEKDWNWQDAELYAALKSALMIAARTHSITIFVDALDEGGEISANHVVNYLYEVHEMLQESHSRNKICFSCRHYPIVSRNEGYEIVMEKENNHDISAYIERDLPSRVRAHGRKSWAEDLYLLRGQIADSARGVFLWATLMIPQVAKEYNKGKSLEQILKMLKAAPSDLGAIYKHIFQVVIDADDHKDSLHLMQWICFAVNPLSLVEIRYAMALDDSAIHQDQVGAQDSEYFIEDDAQMEQLITSLSGGLIEVKDHNHSNVVQFIHQSVLDFLLKGGFRWLGLDTGVNVVGNGHHRLTRSCINCLKLREVQKIKSKETLQETPFLGYAIKSWFLHAQVAEENENSQEDLAARFEWPNPGHIRHWAWMFREVDEYNDRLPQFSTTLFQISAASNLQSVVRKLLALGCQVDERDDDGTVALHIAACFGHVNVVHALLDANAKLEIQNKHGHTALERAASGGHMSIIELLLNKGTMFNSNAESLVPALQSAARAGSYPVVLRLLQSGADINAQGGEFGTALQAAAWRGSEPIVTLLLEKGADINAQGGHFGTALQAAARRGSEPIVTLLLEKGADINAQGGHYGTALQAAAIGESKAIVALLLEKGADINAQGGYFGTALQAAAWRGIKAIVALLLEKGADINAQGGYFGTALQAAARRGSKAIVALLLEKGADINAQGGHFGTALQAAARRGSKAIVALLLEKGADINAQGGYYGTALQAAAIGESKAIVALLLKKGAGRSRPQQ